MNELILRSTLRALGMCLKKVAAKRPIPVTPAYLELQIGLGTCSDWIAWASRLESLTFSTNRKNNSPRNISFLESTRFTYVWTAANALFARDEILQILTSSVLPRTELPRFSILYASAALNNATVARLLNILHNTLGKTRSTHEFPWTTKAHIRVVDLIYYKYTPDHYKSISTVAKAVESVAKGKAAIATLDLPTILYSTRNWLLHGALLNSSFRGNSGQYQEYIETCTEAVALILEQAIQVLESRI